MAVGVVDGAPLGLALGEYEGLELGEEVGLKLGRKLGLAVGPSVGSSVGLRVGAGVGATLGEADGMDKQTFAFSNGVQTRPSSHPLGFGSTKLHSSNSALVGNWQVGISSESGSLRTHTRSSQQLP